MQHAIADRRSIYQRLVPEQLLKRRSSALGHSPPASPSLRATAEHARNPPHGDEGPRHLGPMQLPNGLSQAEFHRAVAVVASATMPPPLPRKATHSGREASALPMPPHDPEKDEGAHGGHDAPNWSRAKSATVLLACTVLYAIIAEILVDVVDVVLNGSGISEKLLGVILFALVPNTTEFMNAISFALNGNIALSCVRVLCARAREEDADPPGALSRMEIGSAYALQVCLIQIPAMLAFSAWYSIGKETMQHRAFT